MGQRPDHGVEGTSGARALKVNPMPIGKSSALLFFEFRNDITNMSPLIDTRVRVPCPCVAPEPRGGRCALAAGPVCAARRLATASSRGARAERKFYNPMNGRGRERCYGRINILISNIVYVRRLTQRSTGVARDHGPASSVHETCVTVSSGGRSAPSMSHGRLSGTFSSACRTSRRVSSGARRARLAGQSHGLATGSSVSAVPYQPARRALRSSVA